PPPPLFPLPLSYALRTLLLSSFLSRYSIPPCFFFFFLSLRFFPFFKTVTQRLLIFSGFRPYPINTTPPSDGFSAFIATIPVPDLLLSFLMSGPSLTWAFRYYDQS